MLTLVILLSFISQLRVETSSPKVTYPIYSINNLSGAPFTARVDTMSIIKEKKIIKLAYELTDDFFFVKSKDGYLCICDGITSTLYIINETGDEICILSHWHEENGYQIISDFFVDTQAHTITILDGIKKQIQTYDFSGERLSVNDIRLKGRSTSFWKISDGYYFDNSYSYKGEGASLLRTDQLTRPVTHLFPEKRQLGALRAHWHAFYEISDTLVYNKAYDSVYYNLIDGVLSPRFKLDFGKNAVRDEVLFQKYDHISDYDDLFEKSACVYFCNVYETKDHIAVRFSCLGKAYLAIISRLSGTVKVYLTLRDERRKSFYSPKGTFEDWFVLMNPAKKDELVLCKFALE